MEPTITKGLAWETFGGSSPPSTSRLDTERRTIFSWSVCPTRQMPGPHEAPATAKASRNTKFCSGAPIASIDHFAGNTEVFRDGLAHLEEAIHPSLMNRHPFFVGLDSPFS